MNGGGQGPGGLGRGAVVWSLCTVDGGAGMRQLGGCGWRRSAQDRPWTGRSFGVLGDLGQRGSEAGAHAAGGAAVDGRPAGQLSRLSEPFHPRTADAQLRHTRLTSTRTRYPTVPTRPTPPHQTSATADAQLGAALDTHTLPPTPAPTNACTQSRTSLPSAADAQLQRAPRQAEPQHRYTDSSKRKLTNTHTRVHHHRYCRCSTTMCPTAS